MLSSIMLYKIALTAAFLAPTWGFLASPRCRAPISRNPEPAAMSIAKTSGSSGGNWALILDCDGVILESESLHREAYNAVFREFEVDYNWSPEYYDVLQNKVGGGKPKMRYYFGENGWPSSKLGAPPGSDTEKDALVDALQDRKTTIYKEFIADGTAVLRPGIQRLIDEAASIPGAKMAICSASTKDSCLFVLDNLLGKDNLDKFDLILAGDDVPRRKPDPMIYTLASEKLGIAPERCMVIEDSLIGLEAALGASMSCVITHTESTKDQDFSGALSIFSELGDDGSVQVRAFDLLKLIGVGV